MPGDELYIHVRGQRFAWSRFCGAKRIGADALAIKFDNPRAVCVAKGDDEISDVAAQIAELSEAEESERDLREGWEPF